MKLIIQV